MRTWRTFRRLAAFATVICVIASLCGCSALQRRKRVKVLILPKFEVAGMEGDFPGEAQLFYENYLLGGEENEIRGCPGSVKLYYKDGVAMCPVGMGKVASALNTSAVLSDERFDYSDAYILSVGCGGAAEGYGIFGDVFVISSCVDFDLGHKADPREMTSGSDTTWFHDESYDSSAVVRLDSQLVDRAYSLVKNIDLATTEKSVSYLNREYPGEEWADRAPMVLRGTSVTADNFWKGKYDHENAKLVTETYDCADPYAITEMEDEAVGLAVQSAGMLDRLIVLRVGVNLDVFPSGVTPELLWGLETDDHIASDESEESVDVFETAMHNCFIVGQAIIEAVLEGKI